MEKENISMLKKKNLKKAAGGGDLRHWKPGSPKKVRIRTKSVLRKVLHGSPSF